MTSEAQGGTEGASGTAAAGDPFASSRSMESVMANLPQPVLQARPGADEEIDGDDELLPAMADDDYSAQLTFQTQSKDNLKYVSSTLVQSFVLTL